MRQAALSLWIFFICSLQRRPEHLHYCDQQLRPAVYQRLEVSCTGGIQSISRYCFNPWHRQVSFAGNGMGKSSYGCQFVQQLMSYARFNSILHAWHYEDYATYTADEIKQEEKKDPFFPVKKFLILLAASFEKAFNPGQFMDIDEQSIPWKGRHIARCYNPNKLEKGEMYSLNDSDTGYMMNFYIYQGKSEQRPDNIPATEYPFHQLIGQNQKYANTNHIIVSDNWYTSIGTMKFCIGSGNHSIGTVKTNKKGLCKTSLFPKTGRGKKKRGEMKQMVTKVLDEKPIYQLSWQDNKPVHLLSTLPSYSGTSTRNATKPSGDYEAVSINRPSVVANYNRGMGGTDCQDQYMSYYSPKIKTVAWTTRVLVHFFSAAVFNAFVLYKAHTADDPSMKQFKLVNFIREVAEALAYDHREAIKTGDHVTNLSGPKKRKNWSTDKIQRMTGTHTPQIILANQVEMRKNVETIRSTLRGHCMICNLNVDVRCEQCQAYLCLRKSPGNLSCWQQFHTCPTLDNACFNATSEHEIA